MSPGIRRLAAGEDHRRAEARRSRRQSILTLDFGIGRIDSDPAVRRMATNETVASNYVPGGGGARHRVADQLMPNHDGAECPSPKPINVDYEVQTTVADTPSGIGDRVAYQLRLAAIFEEPAIDGPPALDRQPIQLKPLTATGGEQCALSRIVSAIQLHRRR